ncbi:transcription elongation factor GreA [Candidatus Parcubacteria bacterium]|nr:MAG: transcription elongation factor GreA [Candidatus Parcubacteria bacterium]
MRVPIRKAGKYTFLKSDPFVTKEKLAELKKTLSKLKDKVQPRLVQEVKRLAELGDFSENVEYQLAKGKLRGINSKILKLEKEISEAQIIEINKKSDTVQIGSLVTVEVNDKQIEYRILGSSETDPSSGVISYQSPLGKVLMNKKAGDIVEFEHNSQTVEYKILKIK